MSTTSEFTSTTSTTHVYTIMDVDRIAFPLSRISFDDAIVALDEGLEDVLKTSDVLTNSSFVTTDKKVFYDVTSKVSNSLASVDTSQNTLMDLGYFLGGSCGSHQRDRQVTRSLTSLIASMSNKAFEENCVVLITDDSGGLGLVDQVRCLKQHGCICVVVHGDSVSKTLLKAAQHSFHWNYFLGLETLEVIQPKSLKEISQPSKVGQFEEEEEEEETPSTTTDTFNVSSACQVEKSEHQSTPVEEESEARHSGRIRLSFSEILKKNPSARPSPQQPPNTNCEISQVEDTEEQVGKEEDVLYQVSEEETDEDCEKEGEVEYNVTLDKEYTGTVKKIGIKWILIDFQSDSSTIVTGALFKRSISVDIQCGSKVQVVVDKIFSKGPQLSLKRVISLYNANATGENIVTGLDLDGRWPAEGRSLYETLSQTMVLYICNIPKGNKVFQSDIQNFVERELFGTVKGVDYHPYHSRSAVVYVSALSSAIVTILEAAECATTDDAEFNHVRSVPFYLKYGDERVTTVYVSFKTKCGRTPPSDESLSPIRRSLWTLEDETLVMNDVIPGPYYIEFLSRANCDEITNSVIEYLLESFECFGLSREACEEEGMVRIVLQELPVWLYLNLVAEGEWYDSKCGSLPLLLDQGEECVMTLSKSGFDEIEDFDRSRGHQCTFRGDRISCSFALYLEAIPVESSDEELHKFIQRFIGPLNSLRRVRKTSAVLTVDHLASPVASAIENDCSVEFHYRGLYESHRVLLSKKKGQ